MEEIEIIEQWIGYWIGLSREKNKYYISEYDKHVFKDMTTYDSLEEAKKQIVERAYKYREKLGKGD